MNNGTYIVNLGAEPENIQLGEREGRKLRVCDNTPGKKTIGRWFNAIVTGKDVEIADRLEKGATIALSGQLCLEEYSPKKPRFKGEKVKVDTMPYAKILQVIKSEKFFGGGDADEEAPADGDSGVTDMEAPSLDGADDPLAGV